MPFESPQPKLAMGITDEPQNAVTVRHFRIAGGRRYTAAWMGMIMPQNRWPLSARLFVSMNQNQRINLETPRRVIGDIDRGGYVLDHGARPQQQAANLPIRAGLRLVQYSLDKLS